MAALTVATPVPILNDLSRRSTSRKAKSVAVCDIGGDEASIALGPNSTVSGNRDVIAVGAKARAHTSGYVRNALAVGYAALAEGSGAANSVVAVGIGAKAVSYHAERIAIAVGPAAEAARAGEGWHGCRCCRWRRACIVSAGPEGKLVIVAPWNLAPLQTCFEEFVNGREFRAGRRYTVDDETGVCRKSLTGRRCWNLRSIPPRR
jgi:hypothetical protein